MALADQLGMAGRPEEGISMAKTAIRLNPHYPPWYLLQLGSNYHQAWQNEEAIETLKRFVIGETLCSRWWPRDRSRRQWCDWLREGLRAVPPRSLLNNRDGFQQTAVDLMQLVQVIEIGMDIDGSATLRDTDRWTITRGVEFYSVRL